MGLDFIYEVSSHQIRYGRQNDILCGPHHPSFPLIWHYLIPGIDKTPRRFDDIDFIKLVLVDYAGNTQTFTITPGNYTVTTFLTALNAQLANGVNNFLGITATLSELTSKFTE